MVVTVATARPELISPGDVSEAEVEGLGLVAGLGLAGDGSGPGEYCGECGVGKGAAISAFETETIALEASIRSRATTDLFIKAYSNYTDDQLDCFVLAKVHRLMSGT